MSNIGKYKRSLKERCPECNKILEIRTRKSHYLNKGIETFSLIEYICCSNPRCTYEREINRKRKQRRAPIEFDSDI